MLLNEARDAVRDAICLLPKNKCGRAARNSRKQGAIPMACPGSQENSCLMGMMNKFFNERRR